MKKQIQKEFIYLLFIFTPLIVIIGRDDFIRPLLLSTGYIMLFFTVYFQKDNVDNHIVMAYLPVSNREIVLQKYILLFINYFLGIIYSLFTFYILSFFGFDMIKGIDINIIARISLPLFLVGSIMLPLYFYFTYKWFNFWNFIVFVFTINFSANILQEDSFLGEWNLLTIFISIIIMYILSLILSLNVYKNRDIE